MFIKALFLLIFSFFFMSQASLGVRVKANLGTLELKAQESIELVPHAKHSGYSPQKGESKWIAIDSPRKKRLKIIATLDQKSATVINSSHRNFSSGVWSFVDPFMPSTSLAIDADHEAWAFIVKKFENTYPINSALKKKFNEHEFELFLINLGHFMHDNIYAIDNLAVRSPANENPVCRHYTTYTSVLFSKLMAKFSKQWIGYIQVAAANVVESDLSLKKDGHAWNLVSVKEGENQYYWLYDAYNYTMVKLNSAMRLSKLRETEFINMEKITTKKIAKNSLFYNISKVTMERFNVVNHSENIYSDDNEEAWYQLTQQVAAKLSSNLTTEPHAISRKTKRPENSQIEHDKRATTKRRLYY